ncbi:MAG: hypothetical protein MUF61_01660, partial [archaeon]|nr:hypothetical protein [archaeon]
RRECGEFRVVRDGERILALETERHIFTLDNTFSFGGWMLARGLEYDAQRETRKEKYLKEQRKRQVQDDTRTKSKK